jgi:hypothetical protein
MFSQTANASISRDLLNFPIFVYFENYCLLLIKFKGLHILPESDLTSGRITGTLTWKPISEKETLRVSELEDILAGNHLVMRPLKPNHDIWQKSK